MSKIPSVLPFIANAFSEVVTGVCFRFLAVVPSSPTENSSVLLLQLPLLHQHSAVPITSQDTLHSHHLSLSFLLAHSSCILPFSPISEHFRYHCRLRKQIAASISSASVRFIPPSPLHPLTASPDCCCFAPLTHSTVSLSS